MVYIQRTFNGALHTDTMLYQYIAALNIKSGSINSCNKMISKLVGYDFDMRKIPVREGLGIVAKSKLKG